MRRVLIAIAALALVAYLLTGFAVVERDERAVVRRFGRVVATPGPGLWVGLPWGLDRVDKVRVSVRQLAVGFVPDDSQDGISSASGRLLTGDQNLVNVKLVVEWTVDDAEVERFVANQDRAAGVLDREAEAAAAEWVGARKVDAVLSGRAALALWVKARLPERIAPHRLGVVVTGVSVESLAPPEAVREAFELVNQAQTGVRTRRNQAEQEADRLRSEASAIRHRLQLEGEAYRDEKTKLAAADARAFTLRREQYEATKADNPDALTALWREEVGRILAGMKDRGRLDVLDDHLGPNGLELNQVLPTRKR